MVGGSGLYLNAVINGLVPIPVLTEDIKIKSLLKLNDIGINSFEK